MCKKDREIRRLQEANELLKRENQDMHHFLADYGLQWVGPAPSSSMGPSNHSINSSARATPPPQTPPPAAVDVGVDSGAPPDMEAVRRSVAELNAIASEATGSGEVVKRRDGSHGFELSPPTLTMTFWRGGLQLDDGAVRGYAQPATVAFLRDLLDGFFPYELKGAYPEGVLFSLVDKRHLVADGAGAPQPHYWGAGRTLDSRNNSRQCSRVGSASGQQRSVGEATAAAAEGPGDLSGGGRMLGSGNGKTSSLLESNGAWLPSAADPSLGPSAASRSYEARDGTPAASAPQPVVGMRPSSGYRPQASTGTEPMAADAAAAATTATAAAGAVSGAEGIPEFVEPRSGELARLQVKGPSGGVALVTELPVETTLNALRELLEARGVVRSGLAYELRTAFPARTLTDHRLSLAQAGLVPSATLLVALIASK